MRKSFPLDITTALEELTIPAYALDRDGRISWLNRGALALVGDCIGCRFEDVVAPEDFERARTNFTKKLDGDANLTDFDLTLLNQEGERVVVRVSSAPLCVDGTIVGIFGVGYPASGSDASGRAGEAPAVQLTARQFEVLALLADGLGTREIANRLGVAEETTRNHIRHLLAELRAHSRLEAVVRAYRLGILQPRREDDAI
jgi:DNA-binding CsgD family transcriptional regulator